ncbi:SH3 domain-containing protein [Paracoccus sp. MBLB3053]|uniref:SH3 domain-containing protein n=1 Tax=Paracoccus aurantius TaxID=3073814 RepID=A0ABU2HPU0_9RHOB|nr:SH3 domain-containing protein [Paracoccus sp. MBLB3053]MDS9467062.1 SH3 domain-containing protein [Paracoccus sp. MBLB3053]
MLRSLLTGLALSIPLVATAQDASEPKAPVEQAPVEPAAAKVAPEEPAAKPEPSPAEPVPAGYLPNLYDVTVIETWDTLNVRENPDGQAKVIAKLPATAKGVELLGRDASGKWGKVNAGERSGWVALRFLKAEPGVWQAASLPQSLSCSGTEPFWSLKATKSGLIFSEPDAQDRQLDLRKVMDRGIEGEPTRGLIAGDDKGRVTAFLRPDQCSDGMSDRGYALAVSVILDGQDVASRMLTGCCSIAR